MYWFLLKKALPFTLTFLFGAALSGLAGLFGWSSAKKADAVLFTRTYDAGPRCRMRRHQLVAESRPLVIRFKPDARRPLGHQFKDGDSGSARVNVTFGADGKVKEVSPLTSLSRGRGESLVEVKAMWEAVESAARRIEFTPETLNGLPVSVTKEVEIRFLAD